MAKSEIFRKSSLDRVSSPEKLDNYIRVSNPSVWIVILTILIMFGVAFVWATFGRLPSTLPSVGVFSGQNLGENNTDYVTCFFSESEITGEVKNTQESTTSKASDSKKDVPAVKIGQKVEISPRGSNSKKDGVIEGVIISIDTSPVTAESLTEIANNPVLGQQLISGSYGYKTLIKIEKTGNNPKWSKKEVPNRTEIKPGTICKLNVFTEEIKPLDFLIS